MVATVLVVTPYSVMDPINLPKMTILGVMSFVTLGFLVGNLKNFSNRQNRAVLSFTLIFQSLLVFNLAWTDRSIAENFYGSSGRNTGILTYLALSILMISACTISTPRFVGIFRMTLYLIGVVLFLYGCFQLAGLEPFPYVNVYANNVFGTFGNPNFQSAFMGILGAIAIISIFDASLSTRSRMLSGGISLASIFGIYSTNSWQGFFNLFAGVAAGFILLLFKYRRFKTGFMFMSASTLGAILVALGIFGKGPIAEIIGKASLEARRLYWESAIQIISSNPFSGVGFDAFGDWYRRGRSEEAALSNAALVSNSAHNVPLDIGVGGGLPVLVIYLGLILLAIQKIVRNVKSDNLDVSYISICAAWIAYQAQSLISINQIGLGIIGWLLLGIVIGYQPFKETPSNQKVLKVTRQASTSFLSFSAPIVGLIVGLILALPPFVAANKFYNSLRSSDVKLVQAAALQNPQDSQRILIAAQVLENYKYYNESVLMVREANLKFPDSFEAWRYLSTLTNATAADKKEALEQMRRLDPNYVQ
jgi:O-antigen ligase